jgi:hypothetical protein
MNDLANMLILLAAPVIGCFGAAFLKLSVMRPKSLLFIVVGITLLLCGQKKTLWAKKIMFKLI